MQGPAFANQARQALRAAAAGKEPELDLGLTEPGGSTSMTSAPKSDRITPAGDFWRRAHKLPPQPQAEDPYQWHLAVILTGAGDKAFIAGADIGELASRTATGALAAICNRNKRGITLDLSAVW